MINKKKGVSTIKIKILIIFLLFLHSLYLCKRLYIIYKYLIFNMKNFSIKNFVKEKNNKIKLFTPGPASLSNENIFGLGPCFGRGDKNYLKLEQKVILYLKKISEQPNIVATQGSGSTALEIVALNFLKGNILIIKTGYYSDRLLQLANFAKKNSKQIKKIHYVDWKKLKKIKKKNSLDLGMLYRNKLWIKA